MSVESVFFAHKKDRDASSVWFYYLTSKDGTSGQCKQCKAVLKTLGGSTKGLHTHLSSKHNIKVNQRKRSSTSQEQPPAKQKIRHCYPTSESESLNSQWVNNENEAEEERNYEAEESPQPQEELRRSEILEWRMNIVQDFIASRMNSLTDAVTNRDEFTVYGEHVANKLRNSGKSRIEICRAQREIGDIFLKLEMGTYDDGIGYSNWQISAPFHVTTPPKSPSPTYSRNSNQSNYSDSSIHNLNNLQNIESPAEKSEINQEDIVSIQNDEN